VTPLIRVEGTSLEGPLLGKHISPDKFEHCLPEGLCLSDFALAMDLHGTPELGWWGGWRSTTLGDMFLRPDLSTKVELAHDITSYLGDFTTIEGTPLPVCPRTLLRTQQARLAALGYEAKCAFELEFFVTEERIDEVRAKKFKVTPLGSPNLKMVYLTQRAPEFLPLMRAATERLESMGIPWEAFNDEAAPGQFELNLAPADPLTMADRVVRTKQVLREVAYEHGRAVTFMARPFDVYGSGLHLHLSLWRDGQPAFGAGAAAMHHWLGGVVATAAGAVSICTPTINAFRRQVDFAAVPTTPTWGEENKGAAFRTVTRSGSVARVEHRIASADANPYLVLAAYLAGGVAGLEEKLEPPPPVTGLPWGLPEDYERLPASITAAADALATDVRLRERLGDEFVHHWVEGRKWEWLMFHTGGGDPDAKTVTDWELTRYFEWV
jgi:glutamine synthetase